MPNAFVSFFQDLAGRSRYNVANSTGTKNMVRITPKLSPAITVTANPIQKTSLSNGMTPKTVVAAARKLIYQQQSVPIYLIVDSETSQLTALKLDENGQHAEFDFSKQLAVEICDECTINVNFAGIFR